MRLIKTRLQKKTGKGCGTCWSVVPKPMPLSVKLTFPLTATDCVPQSYSLAATAPGVVLKVVFVPPGQGEFGPAKMEMLPIEVTQALSTWALAFCGPASSRPMVATLARSSFIYSSTCYETAVSLRASTPECARTKPAHRKLVTPLRQSPQSDRWIEQQRDPLLRCGVSTPLMTA